jgi:hypothetical protein
MAKKRKKKKWMQSAVKRPGQLHRDLGVPQGKKIPKSKVRAAAKRPGKVGQRARLALTMSKTAGKGGRKRKKSKSRKKRK